MKLLDPKLLHETKPIDDDVLDRLAGTLDATLQVAKEARLEWRPHDLEQGLHSAAAAVREAWRALAGATQAAASERTAQNRCWKCGHPLVEEPHGSRWCRNPDCELCQLGNRSRLRIEFLTDPPDERTRELCLAYWQQNEHGFFVYRTVQELANLFGYSSATKVAYTVMSYCKAHTERRCEDCGQPIGRYKSRTERLSGPGSRDRKCSECSRKRKSGE